MFDRYGRTTGYGQIAPGRDVEELDEQGRPIGRPRNGQPNIGQAIGVPQGTFKGAETVGTPPMRSDIDTLFGNTGVSGIGRPGGVQAPPLQSGGGSMTPEQAAAAGYAPTPGRPGEFLLNSGPMAGLAPGQAPPGYDSAKYDGPAAPTAPTVDNSSPHYAAVSGFDLNKIMDPNKHNSKYTDALKTFSAGLGSGVSLGRNKLDAMVAYAKAHGFSNAQAIGDDKIDFGDGEGAIDVLGGGDDRVQFLNNLSAQEPGPASPMGGGIPSAILGAAPTVSGNSDYATRLRQQIMQALQLNPELAAIASRSGY